jgi:predicted HTH transcriptional regulator
MSRIIHENGITLEDQERESLTKRAKSQQELVYQYFVNVDGEFTAEHLWKTLMPTAPLTSTRRCLSNLVHDGKIEKCGKNKGSFGISICKYKLKKEQHEKD